MPRNPTGDAHLDAEIDRAMIPYRPLLPPEMQDVFEGLLVMAFTEHPVGQAFLTRLRPRVEPSGSGKRAILGDAEKATPESDRASPDSRRGGDARRARSSHRAPGGKGGRQ
jgi:hypothetical protein